MCACGGLCVCVCVCVCVFVFVCVRLQTMSLPYMYGIGGISGHVDRLGLREVLASTFYNSQTGHVA